MRIKSAGEARAGARWMNVRGSCAGSRDALILKVKAAARVKNRSLLVCGITTGQHQHSLRAGYWQ
jgi:hypothetical protein